MGAFLPHADPYFLGFFLLSRFSTRIVAISCSAAGKISKQPKTQSHGFLSLSSNVTNSFLFSLIWN